MNDRLNPKVPILYYIYIYGDSLGQVNILTSRTEIKWADLLHLYKPMQYINTYKVSIALMEFFVGSIGDPFYKEEDAEMSVKQAKGILVTKICTLQPIDKKSENQVSK